MRQQKILIVDDDSETRDLCVRALTTKEYEVAAVKSSATAIELISGEQFDLLLTDMIKMPEMTEQVKQIHSDLAIVIMTAHASLDVVVDAVQRQVYRFLMKPFETDQLHAVVAEVLEEQTATRKHARLQFICELTEISRTIGPSPDMSRLIKAALHFSEEGAIVEEPTPSPDQEAPGVSEEEPFPEAVAPKRKTEQIEEVTSSDGAVDFQDTHGIILGNIYEGGVVKGLYNITVKGSVLGEAPDDRCRVESGGMLTLEQDAQGVEMRARSIDVSGNVTQGELKTDSDIRVRGDLADVRVHMGERRQDLLQIAKLGPQIERLGYQLRSLEEDMRLPKRRLLKEFTDININAGKMIQRTESDVLINLEDIYQMLRDREVEDENQYLDHSFYQIVVKRLTTANRAYIGDREVRKQVFLKAMEDLRGLFMMAWEAHKKREEIAAWERKREQAIAQLEAPPSLRLIVKGRVTPRLSINMTAIARIKVPETGPLDIQKRTASLDIRSPEDEGQVTLTYTDTDENRTKQVVDQADMVNVCFYLKDNRVAWEKQVS